MPVAGAEVTIHSPDGELLYRLITDISGQTGGVSLFAPDRATTMTPGGEAYSKYDVTVRVPGYITETIKGAEVYDGLGSTQPIDLHPVYPGGPDTDTIVVPDNALRQDLPRNTDPPESAAAGADPMPDVFIPSRITVHLGTPANTAARNISVSFPDYVKNVTASEIYATWPQASLEANIAAIISVALNRIYTEWYRSRGYNFDITNSTAYDQYYKEGQTIPNNISQIVDRVFSQYIRRIGFREPLFASFCNGTTVTCPGMSQWGSVSLANSGFSPMDILRRYYGDNVELIATNKIADVAASFPGFVLGQGSSGSSVTRMQTYLNRVATNYPAIPKSTPDGVFGPITASAVRSFQRIFNLPQTGTIDRATWNKITSIYVAVTRLAELDSEGHRIGIGVRPPTSTIRQGARGGDVVQLQFLLNAIGTFYDTIPPVLQDASFGPSTTNSVQAFQRQFGLTADGVVGPATWNRLYDIYKSLGFGAGGGGGAGTGIPPYPGTPLRLGSRGSNVELIQSLLNALADKYPFIPKVAQDGVFGPLTQAQVQAFQRQFGLAPDGVVGPVTWNAIMNALYGQGATPPPPPPATPPYPGYPLSEGSVGQSVKVVQAALNTLADTNSSIPRVAVDGVFGPLTRASVIAAQRLLGLMQDGVVGPATWAALVR